MDTDAGRDIHRPMKTEFFIWVGAVVIGVAVLQLVLFILNSPVGR